MSLQQINDAVMELPEDERLELARRIVASVAAERETSQRIENAIPGIEDIVTGRIAGLSESEFRDALR